MNNKAMFSSAKQTWETPKELFDKLNKVFYFNLDAAASKENTLCEYFYTEEDNALLQEWNFRTWVNPPYGRGIIKWVKKAYEESLKCKQIVMLIPARTDTKYQQEYIFPHAKNICFIKGRLKFGSAKDSAPFPSQIIVWGKEINKNQREILEKLGKVY